MKESLGNIPLRNLLAKCKTFVYALTEICCKVDFVNLLAYEYFIFFTYFILGPIFFVFHSVSPLLQVLISNCWKDIVHCPKINSEKKICGNILIVQQQVNVEHIKISNYPTMLYCMHSCKNLFPFTITTKTIVYVTSYSRAFEKIEMIKALGRI